MTPALRRLPAAGLLLTALSVAFPATWLAPRPAAAADLARYGEPVAPRFGRFRAACEDLGQLCFAQGCGGNQIAAALNCRAVCPSSVVLEVVPGSCPLPPAEERVRVRLRARG